MTTDRTSTDADGDHNTASDTAAADSSTDGTAADSSDAATDGTAADSSDAATANASTANSESESTARNKDASTPDDSPPGEWDPEASYRDSSADSLTIPRVETEDAGSTFMSDFKSEHEHEHEHEFEADSVTIPEVSTAESDVPKELLKLFWGIVLVLNAAILAVALGLLFIIFEGVSQMALTLIAGGLVLFGFAYYRYRSYRNQENEFTVEDADELSEGDDDDDTASENSTNADEEDDDIGESDTTGSERDESLQQDDSDRQY
ncbi:uncharacterized protein Nmag_2435 [Natrialba magadii ATCC 43099]|uniref:DUF7322 domain-containing protein n=1 Tax=Natrialba magadii (strain ATCC 43099 / DSM 3394 / CCM 3739 / CIP 104546 / IAM 13178 / JCM 8861 / NBRC 102185 / NCIMB 2190 / MS3) TaxID=547559 RepID=D3SXP7_NATMM|nr:hypothetical protein [Natrialba magadii]ADD05996.1 uncharacterized protein Nmag_2435 [Natrialba magadii ATCC 43099]ELY30495.1 hypothetical protein C500_08237 [Natrialba magadii ATCC 43099]